MCGCEGMVVGTGNHTLAFVRWHFPFQSLCNKFSLVRSLLGLLVTARRYVLVGVTRRKHRAGSWYPRQRGHKTVTVQGGFGACFCRHGTNFIEFWRDRGTSLIGAANLSPVTKLVESTGAVSRYKFDRSQKTVKVYKI